VRQRWLGGGGDSAVHVGCGGKKRRKRGRKKAVEEMRDAAGTSGAVAVPLGFRRNPMRLVRTAWRVLHWHWHCRWDHAQEPASRLGVWVG
jgi:hypothetical protein